MRDIDLKIDPKLKEHFQDVLKIDPNAQLGVVLFKDQLNGVGPIVWSMGLFTPDEAAEIRARPDTSLMVDGMELLITQPELAHELNGKYMDWNDNGVQLIDRN
ncbi:hypothetical protein [Neptuniibacter sp. QD37_11]|uniref:hypothetical protein n=1 Tax=Neptuniibacter sp. QD37_11 TaxID=3398209 RepID=UPI0039F522ED